MKTEYGIPVPRGVPKDWEASSMTLDSGGERLRVRGFVPAEWGDPTNCVAWFDRFQRCRLCVGHYANGRSALLRIDANGVRTMTFGEVPAQAGDTRSAMTRLRGMVRRMSTRSAPKATMRPTPIRTLLMTNKIELLPCPFCGAPAELTSPDYEIEVHCSRCAAKVEAAPEFWNTRHPLRSGEGVERNAVVEEYEPVLDDENKPTGYHRDKRTGEVVTLADEYDDDPHEPEDCPFTAASDCPYCGPQVEPERFQSDDSFGHIALSTSSSRVSSDGTE